MKTPDTEWWQHCNDRDGADAWEHMALDYRHALKVLKDISNKDIFPCSGVVIGGIPSMPNPKERMDYAYNVALNLMEEIEQHLLHKTITVDFLWSWGEFQKAIATLNATLPELLIDRGLRKHNQNQSKENQRQWYARWYEYYLSLENEPNKNRKKFETYFEKILNEIRSGKRFVDLENKQYIIDFIMRYYDYEEDIQDNEELSLTENFRSRKFLPKEIDKAFKDSFLNPFLPPVGEEEYPLEK